MDTVKQAEVFAAVRERFGVERDDSLSLRDFPTLTHVIGWILARRAAAGCGLDGGHGQPAGPPGAAAHGQRPRRRRRGEPAVDGCRAGGRWSVVGGGGGGGVDRGEMTGYPPDLLDLDLDLEADLGVDTVKQAEVFAAVRERFGVERDDSLSLREFPDVDACDRWILDKTRSRPGVPSAEAATAPVGPQAGTRWRPRRRSWLRRRPGLRRCGAGGRRLEAQPGAGPSSDEVAEAVVSIVSEMTGYPPDLLDLDLDLEADLGVDTVKQAEVFAAVRERFGVERDDSLSLRDFPTLTHVIGWILDKTGQPADRRRPAPA